MSIEATRAALLVEVRDNVHETPNPSKNEGSIAATMQAADEYAMAVLEEAWEAALDDVEWSRIKGTPVATIALRARIAAQSQEGA